jgi:hypothetical protein
MSNPSPQVDQWAQVDQSFFRQPGEEKTFNCRIGICNLGPGLCKTADDVRKYSGLSLPDVEFRIVIVQDRKDAVVFIQEKDWQRMQEGKRTEQKAARRQRAIHELKWSPLLLLVIVVVAVIAGLVWMGIFSLIGTIGGFSPNLWRAFIWPAGIVGTISFLKYAQITLSTIFKDD